MTFEELPIKELKPVAPEVYRLRFTSEAIAGQAQPGQFLMIRPKKFLEPLLPRPFSIHRVRGSQVDVLFKAVGLGTGQMAGMARGDVLEVRGPLGRGFRRTPLARPLLVAGGLGVAPLLFLAESWPRTRRGGGSLSRLFVGARTQRELLCLQEFKQAGVAVEACTEDGSYGRKGLVTDALAEFLQKTPLPPAQTQLYVCGPMPMLERIGVWAVKNNLPCQVSLESRMACGLGACLGCVTAKKKDTGVTYVNVCQEGPVFEADQILWNC